MNQFYLPVINQNLYDMSYANLSGLSNVLPHPYPEPVSIEYMMAAIALIKAGSLLSNFRITGLEGASPEVLLFAKDGDFRNFLPNQEFMDSVTANVNITYLDDIAASVAEVIGNQFGNWEF